MGKCYYSLSPAQQNSVRLGQDFACLETKWQIFVLSGRAVGENSSSSTTKRSLDAANLTIHGGSAAGLQGKKTILTIRNTYITLHS